MSSTVTEIDVRTIPPYVRHAQIFDHFDGLQPGEAFIIVNDHNPVPLHMQLEGRAPGQVAWTYLQQGPDLWRVQIGKQAASKHGVEGSCCSGGACCGCRGAKARCGSRRPPAGAPSRSARACQVPPNTADIASEIVFAW